MSFEKISEIEKELRAEFRSEQSKYINFLISLAVSAIAFAIYKTSGTALTKSHWLVGASVGCWGASIVCGLTHNKLRLNALYLNLEYYRILKGEHELTSNHPQAIDIGKDVIKNALNKEGKKATRYFSLQAYMFYTGILFYIIWHVAEMYFLAKTVNG